LAQNWDLLKPNLLLSAYFSERRTRWLRNSPLAGAAVSVLMGMEQRSKSIPSYKFGGPLGTAVITLIVPSWFISFALAVMTSTTVPHPSATSCLYEDTEM